MTREQQLENALRDLVASIDLHTDLVTGTIDRSAIEPWVEKAEGLVEID